MSLDVHNRAAAVHVQGPSAQWSAAEVATLPSRKVRLRLTIGLIYTNMEGTTMSKSELLFLTVILAACGGDKPRSDLTAPYALTRSASSAPTDAGCLLDASDCPPQAWVNAPAELVPEFPQSSSNCDFVMFGLAPTIPKWDFHPTAACRQRQWGNSGIYRQQARDIHVTSLPKMCGGPGDIDEIRLCSLAWKNTPTPFGLAGAAGCVVVKLETTCGV